MSSLKAHIEAFWRTASLPRTPANEETVRRVNLLLDQFAHYDDAALMPHTLPVHRRYLHTKEFVREYIGVVYGELGRAAGEHHVRMDFSGGLPTMRDFALGLVDPLGTKRERDR